MKILIFGATRGVGRRMVKQAYALGHTVSALVRNRAALEPYEDLEQVRGDVLEAAAVSRAVDGQEAVLCALGGAKGCGSRVPATSWRPCSRGFGGSSR